MPFHFSTSFAVQTYYQDEPTFNDVYSKINLPEIKDGER